MGTAQEFADKEAFDEALSDLDTVTESLAGYEELVAQYEAKQKEYEERLKSLTPRLEKAAEEVREEGLKLLQGKIETAKEEMSTAADEGNFEKALERADYLEAALDTYETGIADLERERQEYEDRLAKVTPRVEAAASSGYAQLADPEKEIVEIRQTMESEAEKPDFDKALATMDDLETVLTGYEALKEKLSEQEEAYNTRLSNLEGPLEAVGESVEAEALKSVPKRDRGQARRDGEGRGIEGLRQRAADHGLARACGLRLRRAETIDRASPGRVRETGGAKWHRTSIRRQSPPATNRPRNPRPIWRPGERPWEETAAKGRLRRRPRRARPAGSRPDRLRSLD